MHTAIATFADDVLVQVSSPAWTGKKTTRFLRGDAVTGIVRPHLLQTSGGPVAVCDIAAEDGCVLHDVSPQSLTFREAQRDATTPSIRTALHRATGETVDCPSCGHKAPAPADPDVAVRCPTCLHVWGRGRPAAPPRGPFHIEDVEVSEEVFKMYWGIGTPFEAEQRVPGVNPRLGECG